MDASLSAPCIESVKWRREAPLFYGDHLRTPYTMSPYPEFSQVDHSLEREEEKCSLSDVLLCAQVTVAQEHRECFLVRSAFIKYPKITTTKNQSVRNNNHLLSSGSTGCVHSAGKFPLLGFIQLQ